MNPIFNYPSPPVQRVRILLLGSLTRRAARHFGKHLRFDVEAQADGRDYVTVLGYHFRVYQWVEATHWVPQGYERLVYERQEKTVEELIRGVHLDLISLEGVAR